MSEQEASTKEQEPAQLDGCYSLSVDALLTTMSQVDQVSLHAQVAMLPALSAGHYLVALTLCQGAVSDCLVSGESGEIVLDGARAFHALQHTGDITWSLSPSNWLDMASASYWSDFVPCRVPATVELQQLPQRVRHVLSLMDGNRTLSQIAHLLHFSLDEVFQILRQAHEAGWIDAFPLKEV